MCWHTHIYSRNPNLFLSLTLSSVRTYICMNRNRILQMEIDEVMSVYVWMMFKRARGTVRMSEHTFMYKCILNRLFLTFLVYCMHCTCVLWPEERARTKSFAFWFDCLTVCMRVHTCICFAYWWKLLYGAWVFVVAFNTKNETVMGRSKITHYVYHFSQNNRDSFCF